MIIDDTKRFGSVPNERKDKIRIVCSAYDSILTRFAYASAAITTGPLFYDVLEHYGVRTLEELKAVDPKAAYDEIIRPNIESGVAFAKGLVPKSLHPVLSPSIFEAAKDRWTQDEYMFLWYHVLDKKVLDIHMGPGWNYSNGQVEEFLRGMQIWYRYVSGRQDRDIAMYDHNGARMDIAQGASLIADAIVDLRRRGFDTSKLMEHMRSLHGCVAFLEDPMTSAHEYYFHMPPDYTKERSASVFRERRRAEALAA